MIREFNWYTRKYFPNEERPVMEECPEKQKLVRRMENKEKLQYKQ